ncbi:MAG: Holliday junction branch migration protein RuvA [bacterium]|nr:Holliday junction branch migration protein RuvA [bacterium]
MFSYIEGTLSRIDDLSIVLDVNGVGFHIYVPPSLTKSLKINKVYKIFTSLLLNNEVPILYGFLTEKERDLFNLIINVPGIGPKIGITLISELGYEGVIKSIKSEDLDILGGVSGVGKKRAKKLVLELKDKLIDLEGISQENKKLLTEVLKKLGYNKNEIREVIEEIDLEKNSLEELVKISLKRLSKGNG